MIAENVKAILKTEIGEGGMKLFPYLQLWKNKNI